MSDLLTAVVIWRLVGMCVGFTALCVTLRRMEGKHGYS